MRKKEDSIRRIVNELVSAWNRRDMDAFVRLFAEDAGYVTGNGAHLQGRAAIRRELDSSTPGSSGSQPVSIADLAVRMLGSEAAVALVRWRMDAPVRRGLFTVVVTAAHEGWRIVALHNTDIAA
jgi:uncharacterized protein (TIGR02246 family)